MVSALRSLDAEGKETQHIKLLYVLGILVFEGKFGLRKTEKALAGGKSFGMKLTTSFKLIRLINQKGRFLILNLLKYL